jgi:hypothetical protein
MARRSLRIDRDSKPPVSADYQELEARLLAQMREMGEKISALEEGRERIEKLLGAVVTAASYCMAMDGSTKARIEQFFEMVAAGQDQKQSPAHAGAYSGSVTGRFSHAEETEQSLESLINAINTQPDDSLSRAALLQLTSMLQNRRNDQLQRMLYGDNEADDMVSNVSDDDEFGDGTDEIDF